MKNKYYTPEIEECCLGFEFEQLYEDNWEKSVYSITHINLLSLSYKIKLNQVRVKILDEQDILDCGWNKEVNFYKKITKEESLGEQGYALKLCKNCGSNIYVIVKYQWQELEGSEKVVFKGKIRNKSEFKKILTYVIV